jgi:transposase
VVEATYGWYWAADVLEAAGAEVHLAHPLGAKAFTYRRVKNDQWNAGDLRSVRHVLFSFCSLDTRMHDRRY